MSHRRVSGRLAVMLAVTLALVACTWREDGLQEATWKVFAGGGPGDAIPLTVGDDGLGRIPSSTVDVTLEACTPAGPEVCHFQPDALTEHGLYADEDDVAQLTATATLIFRGEQGVSSTQMRSVGVLGSVEVGPLRFGEGIEIPFGGGGQGDPITGAFTLVDDPTVQYWIRVEVTDCQISNGSACGNGNRRFTFRYRPPDISESGIGSSQSGLEVEESDFVLPDNLGDLQGSPSLFQREGESDGDFQARQVAETDHFAAVAIELGLQELLVARYIGGAQEHTILGVHPPHNVILHAGRHTEPMSDAEVTDGAVPLLELAFAAIYSPGEGSEITFETIRSYDVGIACAISTLATPTAVLRQPVCGWVDQETLGVVEGPMLIDGAEPNAEQAKAQTSRLVATIRDDLVATSD